MVDPTCPCAPGDIVGIHEIAQRAHISLEKAQAWTQLESFPTPLKVLDIGPIWFWPEVEAFTWVTPTVIGDAIAAVRAAHSNDVERYNATVGRYFEGGVVEVQRLLQALVYLSKLLALEAAAATDQDPDDLLAALALELAVMDG